MKCPYCNGDNVKVTDSRELDNGMKTRRRKICKDCNKRFSTMETLLDLRVFVSKNNGQEEPFNRDKIIKGILKAGEKRPITLEQIDDFVDQIEKRAITEYNNLIPSKVIGEEVMNWLRELDQVAYVRYSSVYKDFKDVDSILEVVTGLKKGLSKDVSE